MNKFVPRSAKVAYAQDVTTETQFNRMRGFTSLSTSSNPKEYTRKFVDEMIDTTDVVGYSPTKDFALDEMSGVLAQVRFIDIIENEKIGPDAVVPIVVVDFSKEGTLGAYPAVKRDYVVVGGSHGDNADAYTYSGTLKARGVQVKGTATVDADNETCTFTPTV